MEREAELELARRLIAGDAKAFERFVEHFRAKIFHYSWLMCRHREDAEEVAQETFIVKQRPRAAILRSRAATIMRSSESLPTEVRRIG